MAEITTKYQRPTALRLGIYLVNGKTRVFEMHLPGVRNDVISRSDPWRARVPQCDYDMIYAIAFKATRTVRDMLSLSQHHHVNQYKL